MNIIITGGCGFIGSNLCFYLKKKIKNSKIISIDNLSKSYSKFNLKRLEKIGIKNYKIDISNKKLINQINFKSNIIIDCSAEPAVETSRKKSSKVLNSNLVGTINILEKCRNDNAKIIFLSTSRVYPVKESFNKFKKYKKKKLLDLFDEKTNIIGPKTLYGYSKLASEMLIEEYNYCYNIDFIINRFGLVTGEGQFGKVEQGLVSLWLWSHFQKKKLKYKGYNGKGEQIRDILFVYDLCKIILKQIENFRTVKNEIFCIGGGKGCMASLSELTMVCKKITGNNIIIGSDKHTSIYDIPYYVTSLKKIKKFYNWKPKESLREGLLKMYCWMKNNKIFIQKFF